jgi:hypothetical protein
MSEAATAVPPQVEPPGADPRAPETAQGRVAELRVSGHLMTLDTGVFCVFLTPGSAPVDRATGLPGVRISLPPGPAGRPEAVSISTFRPDGWMESAALVRVSQGPAQVLVTIYQSPRQSPEGAPRLQVTKLSGDAATPPPSAVPAAGSTAAPASMEEADVIAHVQRTGDMGVAFGDWIGKRGSRMWIEGFGIAPHASITADDIEYQAVLGRGWLSPWVEGGKFCGSRGMALPLLGMTIRLKGAAARSWELNYSATFTDGSEVGPVAGGETCEAESLAALEAFQVVLRRRATRAAAEKPVEKPAAPAPRAGARAASRPIGRKPGGAR